MMLGLSQSQNIVLHFTSLLSKVHHCVKSPRPATPGQPSTWSLASSSQTCRWKQCNTALARIVPYNFLHPVDPLTAKRRLPLTSPEKLQCPKLNLIEVPEMYAKIIRSIYLFYCFLILYISIFRPNNIQRYIFLHSFLRFFFTEARLFASGGHSLDTVQPNVP